jgi:hypothetical protein
MRRRYLPLVAPRLASSHRGRQKLKKAAQPSLSAALRVDMLNSKLFTVIGPVRSIVATQLSDDDNR